MRPRIPFARGVSTRVLPVAPVVAKVCSFELVAFRSHGASAFGPGSAAASCQIAGTARRSRSATKPSPSRARHSSAQTESAAGGHPRLLCDRDRGRRAHAGLAGNETRHALPGALCEPDLLAATEQAE